jgi:hypothetical protein
MARFDPVDPRVRLAIAQWPPDAPRGAVSTFCLEHAAGLLAGASTSAPTEGRVMYAGLRALPMPEEPVARL